MKIVRANERGTHFDAPKHWGCWPMRIHGKEETGAENIWVAVSEFLPDGGGEDDGFEAERIYYILEGQLTVTSGGQTETLYAGDSCFRPPREAGSYINNGNSPTKQLVIVVPNK